MSISITKFATSKMKLAEYKIIFFFSSFLYRFSGTLRQARQGEEGVAWVVDSGPSLELDQESGNDITASAATTSGGGRTTRSTMIGRSLWAALRREQLSAAYRSKTVVV